MSIKANFPAIRPTLNLDFAGSKRLDPRISFSRSGSGATYVDANGVIQTAAANVPRFDHDPATGESLGLLIEESRTNSVNYSQYFTLWTLPFTTAVITSNAALAPDGTWTATNYVPSSGVTHIRQTLSSGTVTASVYAKANGLSNVRIGALGFGGTQQFNLSSGTVGAASSITSASIQSCGNGWYRCTATWVQSQNNTFFIDYYTATTVPDGIKGIFLWGAQVETGSFPTSYIPTPATFTGRSGTATYYDSTGTIQTAGGGVARSNAYFPDSNGVMRPAGLLLEAASTNLLNGSATFATSGGTQNNWVDTNITRDGTLRTSPDGTANALRVTASSANATIISSAAIGSSALRTFSIFLRRVTGTGDIQYTLDNGSTWTTQAITTSWSRYSFPATTADQQVGIRLVTSGDAIELWGAQLEDSPYATSHIPTTTATVTRAADVSSSSTVTRSADVVEMTGSNFSSWFTSNSGSFISIAQTPANVGWVYGGAQMIGGFADGAYRSNSFYLNGYYASDVNQVGERSYLNNKAVSAIGGAINFGPGQPLISNRYGFITWSSSEAIYGVNGSLSPANSTSSASAIASKVNRLRIGRGDTIDSYYLLPSSVYVKRLMFYPARLTNAQLQTLTR